VRITSVRNGSALIAEVDATAAGFSNGELPSVGQTEVSLGDHSLCET
jgi:hypothetical protein